MTQAKEFNLLSSNTKELLGEMRPAVEMYYRRLFDYEAELRDMPGHELSDKEINQRISKIVDDVEYGIFAVPKNEDGQTAAVLFARNDDPCRIDIMFVNKSYRGQRLGQMLVEKFQQRNPGKPISVEVARPNETARMFYERMGFVFKAGKHPMTMEGIRHVQ